MSNGEGMKTTARISGGQSRAPIELPFERLNPNEKAVLECLRDNKRRMKIREIMEANGWDKPCKEKGNSRVRNSLRRLVPAGFVSHDKHIGDGTYLATSLGEVEPCSASTPEPRPLERAEIVRLRMNSDYSETIKNTDCSFYNACLDQAISGKWRGFSCSSCTAYSRPDSFQRQQDLLGLSAVKKAADFVEKYGKVQRVRGAKPGVSVKRSPQLKVVSSTTS